MKLTTGVTIAAPRDVVYARALDIEGWPSIISGVISVELLSPGPVGVGTRFRETRVMFGREASEEMTFEEIDPGRRFVLGAFSHGTRYRTAHVFEDEGDGTRFTMVFEGTPVSMMAWVMSPIGLLMKGHLRKLIDGDLKDIKLAIEGGA